MAAGTSNDYALLKSPECTSDECLLVKWGCLKTSGMGFFFSFYCLLLSAQRVSFLNISYFSFLCVCHNHCVFSPSIQVLCVKRHQEPFNQQLFLR